MDHRDPVPGFHPSEILRQKLAKRHSQYYCRIDQSVFAAVFFALLVMLMVSPDLARPRNLTAVDFARTEYSRRLPGAVREDAMCVAVARDGKIYFDNERVGLDALPEEIEHGLLAGSEKRIYLLADARVKYRDVKFALDEIRLAGVVDISFLTRGGPSHGPAPQKAPAGIAGPAAIPNR
jgi:biopolymer transport protein ExbD